jgi:carbonic anhydrase
MGKLQNLFENNRAWAREITARKPDFFRVLSRQQSPSYLWIGCADSRVPANEIVGLLPGELFVHRNVANVVVHTDLNCLSVIQYAVDVLRVRDIIVCGHYGCGGVNAALNNNTFGLIDNWLRHVQDVMEKHKNTLARVPAAKRPRKLCELNVIEQAINVCQTTIVQTAWKTGQRISVHAVIYGLEDGLIHDLGVSVSGPRDVGRLVRRRSN